MRLKDRELSRTGVLPSLAGEDCPGRSCLYRDGSLKGRSAPPALAVAAQLRASGKIPVAGMCSLNQPSSKKFTRVTSRVIALVQPSPQADKHKVKNFFQGRQLITLSFKFTILFSLASPRVLQYI